MNEYLKSLDEIVSYIHEYSTDLEYDDIYESLSEQYGDDLTAVLKTVDLSSIHPGHQDGHLMNSSKQKKYDRMNSPIPPIIIDENMTIIDGHHRYRSAIKRNLSEIQVYQIIINE